MKLVWKLLRQNISKPQLIGFFCANLFGLSIVLLAFQFYFDISPVFSDKDNLFKDEYLTISKEVSLMSNLTSGNNGFTKSDIESLKQQKFIKDVGYFTSSQYSVFAGINNLGGNMALNTQMFFESVPDKFIDIKSDEWQYSPGDKTLPIILPKDYLDLYNFGFAESNALPKITEGLIGMVNVDIIVYTKYGQREDLKGRIVGFSNRLNSILVPEEFMEWANQKYGNDEKINPSRLIVEVNNAADADLANYFKSKGYEISGEKTAASRMSFLLKITVLIVVVIGLVICGLSFFILVLSIYLLLEKNMTKLKILRLLGYSKSIVVHPYEYMAVGLNLIILALSLIIIIVVRGQYSNLIAKLTTIESHYSFLYTAGIGVFIFVLLSIINIAVIRNKVK